ncbi:MAG: rRNA maturation RNase YbeY [Acholeplasmataceae bacterium]
MKISFYNQTDKDVKNVIILIKNIFKKVKDFHCMQIVFVSLDQIHELNKKFRDVDRPTDVLSFPNDEKDDRSLGDIFICLDKANIQANDYGHSFEREVGFLAVHGYLHLKGYDHHSPEEEKIMIEAQEKILKKAKLGRVKL